MKLGKQKGCYYDYRAVLSNIREIEKSMRVIVKIPKDEEDRITVNKLIQIRNSAVNERKDMNHRTLKTHLKHGRTGKITVKEK